MADVDALAAANSQSTGERLVHVAEQDVPRLRPPDRIEQRRTAPFHPLGDRVEEQLGNVRRYVRTENVDLADGSHLGRVRLVVDLVRRTVRRPQPAADEAKGPTAKLDPLPVQYALAWPQVRVPHARNIDVAVCQVGRRRQGREQLRVLPRRRSLDVQGAIAAQRGPQPRRHRAGLVESLLGTQRDVLPRRLRAEEFGENALPVIGVVDEQQQIAEADQRVCAVGCGGQRVGPAVHVADHVNPHDHQLRQIGRPARRPADGTGRRLGQPAVRPRCGWHQAGAPASRHLGQAAPRPGMLLGQAGTAGALGAAPSGAVRSNQTVTSAVCRGEPVRTYSAPAVAAVPDSACLADVVFSRADSEPAAVMLRRRTEGGQWRDVTSSAFRDEVTALARGIIAAGIEPGDRIALMSRTRYEWTLIDYAIWTAGAVTVPVYETSSAEQVEWMLGDSGARAVFAETSSHAQIIDGVSGRLAALDLGVWKIDEMDALLAGGTAVSDDQLGWRRAERGAADLATIIYTSGTTGRPKGCELTHRNLLADVRNAVAGSLSEVFDTAGSATLLFLPLAHSFARIIQVGCIESGAVLGHWPDTSTLMQGLSEFQPSFLLAVPRVFEKVYNGAQQQAAASKARSTIFGAAAETAIAWSKSAADGAGPGAQLRLRHALFDRLVYARLRAAVGGKVQYAVSGGAPLGDRLGHFFRGAGLPVLEGYGLTETSAAATVNRPRRNKIGTVGMPLPGVSVRIADDGEILIGGPNVFFRYWRNPEATADVLDADGWLHTGDIGELDDEGFLRVTGRQKELIVTAGGKNVAPAVLEDRIRAHPLISQAMVVGDGRPYIACLITLDADALSFWKERHGRPATASAADLADDPELIAEIQEAVDDANNAVSRAESIKRFSILGADFTEQSGHLTPSLKVRRNVVAKDFSADIDALYS